TAAGNVCVTVKAPAAGPDIHALLPSSTLQDSCPSDPSFPPGSGVSPGETLRLTLAIQNQGGTDASGSPSPIKGTLQPGAGYTIVTGASSYTTTVRANTL